MPSLSIILSAAQQQAIVNQTAAGISTQQIADTLGFTYHTVYHYQRKHAAKAGKEISIKSYKKKVSKSIVQYKNDLPATTSFQRPKGEYSNQRSIMGIDYNDV